MRSCLSRDSEGGYPEAARCFALQLVAAKLATTPAAIERCVQSTLAAAQARAAGTYPALLDLMVANPNPNPNSNPSPKSNPNPNPDPDPDPNPNPNPNPNQVKALQWCQRQGLLQYEAQGAASGGLPGANPKPYPNPTRNPKPKPNP